MPALTSKGMAANWSAELAVCHGCGATLGDEDQDVEHRPDCTVEPSPLLCEDCGDRAKLARKTLTQTSDTPPQPAPIPVHAVACNNRSL